MASFPSLDTLLGRTIRLGDARYKLVKCLGGGATAVVFLAQIVEGAHQGSERAIKFTADQETAEKERKNLVQLNHAQERASKHYFPELYFPHEQERLSQEFLIGQGEWQTSYVLVQEYVRGIGVHDLLLDYPPDLRLPEPLALTIGYQYVDMMTILHNAGITGWDRKLTDLRWSARYAVRADNWEDLQRWQKGVEPGRLMVIDWNVTGDASSENVANDLVRFGLLWHRMLLGVEPRFQEGETLRLQEPLEVHEAWNRLSFATQQVLKRLLQSTENYTSAEALKRDLERTIGYWREYPDELRRKIARAYHLVVEKGVFERYELEDALAAASVLLHRLQWGEPLSFDDDFDLERIHRALSWALDTDGQLIDAMHRHAWSTVRARISDLLGNIHDPIDRLWLMRHDGIAHAANVAGWSFDEALPLIERSNTLRKLDRSSRKVRDKMLSDSDWDEWKKISSPVISGRYQWEKLRNELIAEFDYRRALTRFRHAFDARRYYEAKNALDEAEKARGLIIETDTTNGLLSALDDIYVGDLEGRKKHLTTKLAELSKASQSEAAIVEQAVRAIEGTEEIETSILQGVSALLQSDPGSEALHRLLRALQTWQSYRRLGENQLILRLMHLRRVTRETRSLLDALGPAQAQNGNDVDANRGAMNILQENTTTFQESYRHEWEELRTRLLGRIRESLRNQPPTTTVPGLQQKETVQKDLDDAWQTYASVGELMRAYRAAYQETFGEPDQKFVDEVSISLQGLELEMKKALKELREPAFEFDDSKANRLTHWLSAGQIIAKALDQEWPTDVELKGIEEKAERARADFWKRWAILAHELHLLYPAPNSQEA